MKIRRALPILILLFCAAGFGAGLFRLFQLRFEIGDVYPAYSSLRSDPLGTMAFWESLSKLPRISVRRDFSNGNRLPDGKGTTYLHIAGQPREWESLPKELANEIDRFVRQGGRLAVTFYPETSWASAFRRSSAPTNAPAGGSPGQKRSSPRNDSEDRVRFQDRFGVGFSFQGLTQDALDHYRPETVVNSGEPSLPDRLDWHSGLIFTNLSAGWRTIYTRRRHPVVIEHKLGLGSIVMATDSYFLSNEALIEDRHADLLAWLVAPGQEIVFDEAHFGIVENPGVAGLMRAYRLHGVGAGLLLLAGLFIWKNAASFVPVPPKETRSTFAAGRDAAAGFVNLLRRNIEPRRLLEVCFTEWTKSLSQGDPHTIARVDQAQAVVETERAKPPATQNPLRAYQEICRALKR